MNGDYAIFCIVFLLGILVGLNKRAFKDLDYKKKLVKEIDLESLEQLKVANNLNESLKQDVKELKDELWKLKRQQKGS